MQKLLTLIITLLFSSYAFAIGEWTAIPNSENFRRAEIFAGNIYMLSGNTLFSVVEDDYAKPQQYSRLNGLNGSVIFDIIVSQTTEKLIIVYEDGNIDFINADGHISNLPDFANKSIMGDRSLRGISERAGNLYISTGFGFLIVDVAKEEFLETYNFDISQYEDGTFGNRTSTVTKEMLDEMNEKVRINGPESSPNAFLAFCNGRLISINADSDVRWGGYLNRGIISFYDVFSEEWHSINSTDVGDFYDGTRFSALTCVGIDPNDNEHFWAGSFEFGLYEFLGDSLVRYFNKNNSDMVQPILPGTNTTRIGGICIDQQGYTWFTNTAVDQPLGCITPSGEVLKFNVNGYQKISNGLDRLIIAQNDPYNFKWMLSVRSWQATQIAIYYDGGTPEDTSDDENVAFSSLTDQDGNNYIPDYFSDIAEDKNGAIWLLTSSGPFVFDSQIDAYRHPGQVRRIKIPRNDGTNLADYLLAGVDCSCIVVDAANGKWIGTKDAGLYLISADGLKQIEHFSSSNSPLPSDNILALAYDDETGTLYVSCEGGMVSYVTDAVRGAENYSNVICYPNPVRPEYSGPLHITGLKDNTKVRICDITNNPIYTTFCSGGSVTWDLVNDKGQRVKPGVYIVYGYDTDGHGGIVTKFLVI